MSLHYKLYVFSLTEVLAWMKRGRPSSQNAWMIMIGGQPIFFPKSTPTSPRHFWSIKDER